MTWLHMPAATDVCKNNNTDKRFDPLSTSLLEGCILNFPQANPYDMMTKMTPPTPHCPRPRRSSRYRLRTHAAHTPNSIPQRFSQLVLRMLESDGRQANAQAV